MPDLRIRFENDEQEATSPRPMLDEDSTLALLREAEITAAKLVPWGSNYTFAVGLSGSDGVDRLGIYKPQVGERPLWDFPSGTLYLREYASYLLSRFLGWNFVPPTVVREGPHGIGSLQLYVEPTEAEIDESQFWGRRILSIERFVMFDFIANNADRKIGHCLVDRQDRLWGIDHGLTFNVDPKLRTVLWQFSGEPIDESVRADVERMLCDGAEVIDPLGEILHPEEIDELKARATMMLESACYPLLDPRYNVPHGWW